MTKRWKDRIQILVHTAGTYDAWGHSNAESWKETAEIWADVRTQLNSKSIATVTVRAPFDYADNIRIQWNDQLWKLIQPPLCFSESQLVQFKIEQF